MPTRFRRILVPHDYSTTATHALRIAADLAEVHDGTVIVLHVLTPLYGGPGYPTRAEIEWTPPAQLRRERERHLATLVRATLGPKAKRVTCRVAIGEAVPAILAAAKRVDLIVLTTLGRTGLARVLLGSVAERIVRHSPVPVLTVRAPAPRRRGQRAAR
jgi:universal stress protein A